MAVLISKTRREDAVIPPLSDFAAGHSRLNTDTVLCNYVSCRPTVRIDANAMSFMSEVGGRTGLRRGANVRWVDHSVGSGNGEDF